MRVGLDVAVRLELPDFNHGFRRAQVSVLWCVGGAMLPIVAYMAGLGFFLPPPPSVDGSIGGAVCVQGCFGT